jgi:hypothetical protein
MRYLSIDIETTGLDRKRCSLIEIAMVLEDTEAPDWRELGMAPEVLPAVEVLPTFHCFVPNRGAYWEPIALEMHKERMLPMLSAVTKRPGLAEFSGVRCCPQEVFAEIAAGWLLTRGIGPRGILHEHKITVAGKNFAGFDAHFLPPELLACFDYRVLDPGSVFVDFDKDRLPSLGALLEDKPVAHTALEDARDVVRVLRRKYT